MNEETKIKRPRIDSVDALKCTGCGVCIAICPKRAIVFRYNNEGFLFPEIDGKKCVDCGVCYQYCPSVKANPVDSIKDYYVIQNKDPKVLHESASGAAFAGFAQYVIQQNGIVCGCILGDDLLPKHILTHSMDDVFKMQGSKYVQSYIESDVFENIKSQFMQGTLVLFSGTPCQIAGLKQYLKRDFQNLITMYFICHGVGSRGVFLNYILN